jgi:uncharacterized protein (DUF1778 family)
VSTRSSQLQVRVSPAQKEALKRLAELSGQTVSAYVLSKALPATTHALDSALHELRAGPGKQRAALTALRRAIADLPPLEFEERLQSVRVSDLPPLTQNRVAGLVEEVAHQRRVDPPPWVGAIAPLENPHFRWALSSLRPYQLRAGPVSLKRRNVFDPSAVAEDIPAAARTPDSATARLQLLEQALDTLELDVEFYFLSGAVVRQAFAGRPGTAHPRALFKPWAPVAQATREVGQSQGWPDTWVEDTLREILRPAPRGSGFVDLRRLKAFAPPPEYVLAIKVASATTPIGARDVDDLRFLLRSINLTTPDAALSVVTRYFAPRYLPPDTTALLARLLSE